MKIAPVSFGKSVRVNGSIQQAFDIARLANEKKASNAERTAQKEAKSIFNDVDIARAQVATYINPYGETEVYIVSGKESKKFDRLNDEIANGIIQAGETLKDSTKFKNSVERQTNNHNQKVRKLLLDSTGNFDISAIYDKSQTRVKSIEREYDSVYALAGTPEQLEDLQRILKNTKGVANYSNATHLYQGRKTNGLCSKAVQDGKEIAFVVTGKENNRNISFMEFGWSSINAISRRIEKFISLENVPEQAKAIQEAMEYDYKKGTK